MRQSFEIPGRLPGLNEYTEANRKGYRVGNAMKRDATDTAMWCIRAAGLSPMERADIRFTWVEPNMRRDKDNIRFAAKFILDALVRAGVLANDGWKQVGDMSDTYYVNKENPRIVVELEGE